MRIPCTCGCGLQVTHATKINHLNGRGKTSLRARVLEENESLRTRRQQPILLQDRQAEKRSHPSSNQVSNHKRLKVAQPEIDESFTSAVPNEKSDIFPIQAYADPMESPPTPVPNQELEYSPVLQVDAGPEESLSAGPNNPMESLPTPAPNEDYEVPDSILQVDEELKLLPAGALSSARQSSRIAERTRHMAEQRWGNSHLRDESPRSDRCGNGHWSEDEEDVNRETEGENDRDDDEDRDDEDRDDEDNDESGISTWDLLGDRFECEATSIGMSLAHDSSIYLTIV
jgi:hypothetical protein